MFISRAATPLSVSVANHGGACRGGRPPPPVNGCGSMYPAVP